jgi:hypothetical protein
LLQQFQCAPDSLAIFVPLEQIACLGAAQAFGMSAQRAQNVISD